MKLFINYTKASRYAEKMTLKTGIHHKIYTMKDVFDQFYYLVIKE